MKATKHILYLVLAVLLSVAVPAQAQHRPGHKSVPSAKKKQGDLRKKATQIKKDAAEAQAQARKRQMTLWVDSVMSTFTLDQKIGQLLMVRVPTNMKSKDAKSFEKVLTDYHVGGVCFFAGTATQQLQQTVRYQRLAEFPLFVSIDGEWGLGMRLTDQYSFPRQMMMGALSPANDTLVTLMGNEVGRQCAMMGIHINFAPVADLNSNPSNPVIGARSFGEDRRRVADKCVLYAKALQNNGVMAVAKHFPGHGDTETDSHVGLPVINHSKSYIDSVDVYPFRRLVRNGVRGVMVAHLQVNAYDGRPNTPSTTSEAIVNQLLRKQLGFNGLIFTDGMDMGAITKTFGKGEGELAALLAGVDVLLLPSDVSETVRIIRQRAEDDADFARLIDLKCRNVLREKYRSGLHRMDLDRLTVPTQTDRRRCDDITARIAAKALTLVRNEGNVLPLKPSDKVCFLAVGNCDTAVRTLDSRVVDRIARADKVVVCLHARCTPSKNYGVSAETLDLIRQISAFNPRTALVVYGSPYILKDFQPSSSSAAVASQNPVPAAIVVAYQDLGVVCRSVETVLRSGAPIEGCLPVTVKGYGPGLATKAVPPPPDPYAAVKAAGMDASKFRLIDSIALMGIEQRAYPGCQILVAKGGRVVYNRCYGRQTYDESSPAVDTNTVYDLASLTKVTATTFAVMRLVDAGKLGLDDELSRYLPYLKHTNKKHITVRQALSHIARLKAFDAYYKKVPEGCGNISVDPSAASCEECRRQMMELVARSNLEKETKYLYSDLGFMLLADVVRVVSGQSLDLFMSQQFYKPMGMTSTTFCPRLHGMDTNRIAPTERDTYYRHRLLRGEVHDQNAAAMGGVSGHAGLFSTASDLNRLYQMMLSGGTFQGRRYLSQEVLDTFNRRYYADKGNRRSLGYDKPFIHGASTHCAPEASQQSFGHTGFTGTMVWVDPQYDLVYIFLSNRVHPDSSPNRLASLNIRTDIQSLIYQSMGR